MYREAAMPGLRSIAICVAFLCAGLLWSTPGRDAGALFCGTALPAHAVSSTEGRDTRRVENPRLDTPRERGADRGGLPGAGAAVSVIIGFILAVVIVRNRRLAREVAERKKAEKEYVASERKLAAMSQAIDDAVVMIDSAGRVVFWNHAAERLFGFPEAEAIGIDFHHMAVLPEDQAAAQRGLAYFAATGRGPVIGITLEREAKSKSGRTFPVEVSVTSVTIQDEWHAVGVVRDITERKQAEEELKKLSRAVEQSPASVIITDPDGTIEYVNHRFCEVTGYSAGEAVGRNPRILNSGHTPARVFEDLWKTITAGREWRGEFANRKKSGEIYWESASISPIKSRDGSIACYLAVKEDITERKRMEKDIQERIHDLDETQSAMLNMMEDLDEEKRKAEAATRAKSDFLANMSHEIRTPMNAILGMTHLALMTDLTPKQRDYVGKAHLSAQSLLGIINDILDFSKIEAGKLDMETIDFDLGEVLENLSNLITMKAQEKGLELVFAVDPEVPTALRGDPLRLGQILLNLTGNAVKFTDRGEIVVEVKPRDVGEEYAVIHFKVKDTGVGLTGEQQDGLFRSFHQADTSTTRKYGGTGLGLAISKKLTEMMEGRIGVESEPGQGATFFFTARFGRQREDAAEPRIIPEMLRNTRALIADDNETFREVLTAYLEGFTFHVTSVPSGREALREIHDAVEHHDPYDVVYLDWQMPEMSGLETAKIIRSDPGIVPRPKVIMVTGHGRADIMKEAEHIGLDGFLLKPVTPSLLMDATMDAFARPVGQPRTIERITDRKPEGFEAIRGARVLLVEDNEINQQVAVELLRSEGFVVAVAGNGKEAVDAVTAQALTDAYDVVLMDLQMPVMDGFTATEELRRHKGFDELPIIAMTADAMAGVRERVLDSGMNDFVTKPINPGKLFGALVRWITPGAREITGDMLAQARDGDVQQALEALPELQGIEVKKGLARVGGNAGLYGKLLAKFLEDYSDITVQLRTALDDGDGERALRLAHTVKGVSANLGMERLREAAEEMESVVRKSGIDAAYRLIGPVAVALEPVLDSLRKLPVPEKTPSPKQGQGRPRDPGTLRALLESLLGHVERHRPKQCKEVMGEIEACSWPEEFGDELLELGTLVGKYRFDDARSLVASLLGKLDAQGGAWA